MKNKNKQKSTTASGIRINAGIVFLLAFGMAFLCFLPFFIKDGGFFVYFGDYNMQQLPFYIKVHEAVRSGTFFFDLKTDLGSSIYTSYSFYLLASPFFWLTVPFPAWALPYLLPFFMMLKITLASVFAYLYIGNFVKEKSSACIGGLLYGFCGFQAVSLVFNHFLDVTALFPLYLIATDKLLKEKKRGYFALMTACMALTNYFFFIGEVVFIVLYVILRYVVGNKAYAIKERILLVCRTAIEGVIGVLMSAFFLLPSLIAVAGNDRVSSTIFERNPFFYEDLKTYGALLKNMFLPPDVINCATLFGTEEGTLGCVSLFLPLFALSGVIAFFMQKGACDFCKKLCVVSLILAFIPMGNALFFAGNATYYARWFYMPLLIMALMTAVCVEEFDQKAFGIGTIVCALMFFVFLLIGFLSMHISSNLKEFITIQNRSDYELELAIAGCSLLVLVYLVWILRKDAKKKYLFTILVATALCCVVSLYAHMYTGYSLVNKSSRENYKSQLQAALDFSAGSWDGLDSDADNGGGSGSDSSADNDGGSGSVSVADNGGDFYRIESDESRINYGMVLEKPSVSSFISTISGSIMDFYAFAGIERKVQSEINYDRCGMRSLLSVRYYLLNESEVLTLGSDEPKTPDDFHKISEKNGFVIYENENYLKAGTIFDSVMLRSEYEKLSEEEQDLALIYALVIDENDLLENDLPENDSLDNSMTGSDSLKNNLLENDSHGTNFSCVTAEEFHKTFSERKENFKTQCDTLNLTAADNFSYDDTVLQLTYTDTKGGMVFLSIPYSSGFTAYADDKEVDIHIVDGGLMSVCIPAGTETLKLTYREPGLSVGIILSIIGVLLWGALFFSSVRKKS